MSAMVNLEVPWINVLSKMDLVTGSTDDPSGGARNGIRGRRNIARFASILEFAHMEFTVKLLDIWTQIHCYSSILAVKERTQQILDFML
jgi:hypothetical protein